MGVVVGDQVGEDALDVVAEPAAAGVSPAELPLYEPQGELLEDLVGRVRVAERTAEVATSTSDAQWRLSLMRDSAVREAAP
jgi:hypothetical protein